MQAAFFDLDKTVIARPSIMAFARDFRREGLLRRRTMVRAGWTQLVYVKLGAGHKQLTRIQQSVLRVTAGWEQEAVRRVVTDRLAAAIDPLTYTGALDLIAEHRRAGRRVYLVSAAPTEMVEAIGHHLGVDRALGSIASLDAAGRYSGTLERYVYGATKATVMREVAMADGVDLDGSWAYTDSFTDLPMLEVVGHPVAVNPDRALRRVARMHGWEIRTFEARGGRSETPAGATTGTPHRVRRAVLGGLLAGATTGGGVAAVVLRRRSMARRLSTAAPVVARRLRAATPTLSRLGPLLRPS